MDTQRARRRLLEIEKTLSARTQHDLARARDQAIDTAHDVGDSSVVDVAAGDEFTQAELDSTILNAVREALRRIDDGTYGRCLTDGRPISEKRLEAVPWAAYCVKHQKLIEASAEPPRNWTL